MIEVDISDEKLFNPVYIPYFKNNTRIQIFYGGSSGGKTVSLSQRCVIDLLEGGRNYLIIRNTANTLRASVFNEIRKVIWNFNLEKLFKINKSEMTITCINRYQIYFRGLDDTEKLKGIIPIKGVITDIWVEEATETKYESYKQLSKRLRGKSKIPKRITLSFNPIMRSHWIFKEFFTEWVEGSFEYHDDKLSILKTTYKDNLRFLEQDDIDELENEKDRYYHEVYTLGNWGVLGGLIYTNWTIADLSKIKNTFGTYYNGLDFGYSNDQTAVGRQAIKGKNLYILDEMIYELGLTNNLIAAKLLPAIHKEYIRCDNEPKSIAELRGYGINALAAKKGPGSVNFGIQYIKQFNIIIDKSCQNAINEFQQYQWKKNKDGETINEPVKKNDHFMDQIRYALNDRIFEKKEEEVYTASGLGIF